MPRVSILTAARDTPPRMLSACYRSLCAQWYADWEWILVDDGTQDSEARAALEYAAADPQVRLTTCQPIGLPAALNAGLGRCRGALVARMDSDDVALPQWLLSQVAYLQSHPAVDICGCQVELFRDLSGQTIGITNHPTIVDENLFDKLAARGKAWAINHPGVIFRRRRIAALGRYDERLQPRGRFGRYGEDIDLWRRCLAAGLVIHNQPDVLVRYRRPERSAATWHCEKPQ